MKFRPTKDLEGVSIEHIPYPHPYHRLITMADVEAMTGPFGSILQQVEKGRQYLLTKHCFQMVSSTTLVIENDGPVIVLSYTLEGNMVMQHSQLGKLEHFAKTAYIYYLSPGKHKITVPEGNCTTLKLHITEELLVLACHGRQDMEELLRRVQQRQEEGWVMPLVKTWLNTSMLLNRITHCIEKDGHRKLLMDWTIQDLLLIYVKQSKSKKVLKHRPYRLTDVQLEKLKHAEVKLGKEGMLYHDIKLAAKILDIPVRHFAEGVKIVYSCGWPSLQKKLKAREACVLLLTTDYTVQQISYKLRYKNAAAFGRSFREEIGCPPEEYRRAKSEY